MIDWFITLLLSVFTIEGTPYLPELKSWPVSYGEIEVGQTYKTEQYCNLKNKYSPELQKTIDRMIEGLNKTEEGKVIAYNIEQVLPCTIIAIEPMQKDFLGSANFNQDGNIEVKISANSNFNYSIDDYAQVLVHELTHAVDLIKTETGSNTYEGCTILEAQALRSELVFIEGVGTKNLNPMIKPEIKVLTKDSFGKKEIDNNSNCKDKIYVKDISSR